MRVTVNGNVTKDALKIILDNQKQKVTVVDNFCKENKINNLYYKDAELEYEYRKRERKVEVRSSETNS